MPSLCFPLQFNYLIGGRVVPCRITPFIASKTDRWPLIRYTLAAFPQLGFQRLRLVGLTPNYRTNNL